MERLVPAIILFIASLLALASRAEAAEEKSAFTVSATIVAQCTVDIDSPLVDFGAVKGITDLEKAAPTSISLGITCTNSTNYTVQLDSSNKDGSQFRMKNGTNHALNYGIFKNANGVDEISPATPIVSGGVLGNGAKAITNLYFKLEETDTNLPTGSYSDTITVTVSY